MSDNFSLHNWKKNYLPKLLQENQTLSEYTPPKGWSEITPNTELKVGDDIMIQGWQRISTIIEDKGNGKYRIEFHDDGQKATVSREKLEQNCWVSQKKLRENQEVNEAPASLADAASKLYEKMLNSGDTLDINDEYVDGIMEEIVSKVGHTPEQKKKKGFYKFAFGAHPQFSTLTDNQLQAIIPFLKAVIKRGYFNTGDNWDGTKITSEDEYED